MLRLSLALGLFLSAPTFACPMQDAAVYQEAAKTVAATEGTQVAFSIEGMSCGDCSAKVVTALNGIDGVNAAAVDYQTGEARVAFDAAKTNPEALLAAIQKVGYKAETKQG